MISAVALSRLFLGVHWPIDVIVSIILGILISYYMVPRLISIAENYRRKLRFIKILNILTSSVLLIFLLVNFFMFQGTLKIMDLVKTIALLNGVSWGFLLDSKKECFIVDATIVLKIFRYLVGLLGVFILVKVSKSLLPFDNSFFHYFRYFLGGFWISFFFPFIGTKLGFFKT